MIISPKYKIAYVCIENAGCETFEEILTVNDKNSYSMGDFHCSKDVVPEGYQYVVFTRNPTDRLMAYYDEATKVAYRGYPKFYSTFEEFVWFITNNKDVRFLVEEHAPQSKYIGRELVNFPVPAKEVEKDMPVKDVTINYETFRDDVIALLSLDTEYVINLPTETWVKDDLTFIGVDQLTANYEEVI